MSKANYERNEATLVWEEYRYRHDHCWQTIFRLTTATVALGALPYAQKEVTCVIGWGMLMLPFVGILLLVFGLLRINRELKALSKVKNYHRNRQCKVHHWCDDRSKSRATWLRFPTSQTRFTASTFCSCV